MKAEIGAGSERRSSRSSTAGTSRIGTTSSPLAARRARWLRAGSGSATRSDASASASTASGSTRAGCRPRPTRTAASEEIVFVLGGSGFSWQDEQVYELRPGDCVVHLADHEEHTLRGGPDGLDVLIYGTRHPTELGWLPRSKAIRLGWPWVEGRTDDPWDVEAQAEPLVFGDPARGRRTSSTSTRPRPRSGEEHDCGGVERTLGRQAGSMRTGMRHEVIPEGKLNCPPHCHGSEEEFFVVLDGEGTCLLGDEEHPVRRGSIVGRPPGNGRRARVPRGR